MQQKAHFWMHQLKQLAYVMTSFDLNRCQINRAKRPSFEAHFWVDWIYSSLSNTTYIFMGFESTACLGVG
ncbi:hypothetical protein L596_025200 [Steinernema carpocapsae]|uniref:Uncharacterized protein n=1 Tax=Steinernema carpocapsae TaxID=34508 RepID=A0A4U5M739_STECR|nr:hypothetical protein L596_025200 [Steinernema carpocapsae]